MNGHVWISCLETKAGSVWERRRGSQCKERKEHLADGLCLAAPIINTDLYQSSDEYREALRNTNGFTL